MLFPRAWRKISFQMSFSWLLEFIQSEDKSNAHLLLQVNYLKAHWVNLTENVITYHFHQTLLQSGKRFLENRGTSRQPDHEISLINGNLRLNLDLIKISTSDAGIFGDAQVRSSQECSEHRTSPSTSWRTNEARRNLILFTNDRCTINFDMEFMCVN